MSLKKLKLCIVWFNFKILCNNIVLFFIEYLGNSDALENGSSGETSDDFLFEIQNSQKSEVSVENGKMFNVDQEKDSSVLWSNSSR